jgi:enterochelin esterase family protein
MTRLPVAVPALLLFPALLAGPPLVAQAGQGHVLEGRTLQSAALGREWAYTVYLPPGYEGEERAYPTFYLLHGYGGEHTSWARYGDAAMTADSLIAAGAIPPVILVMPDGMNSWWVDSDPVAGFGPVETAFVQDLIPHVDRTYRTIPLRRARMVGGLSMGGYGALHLALKHPDLFGGAASLSGALSRTPPERTVSLASAFGDPFDPARWQAENPFVWIERLKESELRLPVYVTVGDDDGTRLLEGAVDFYAALRDAGLPCELRVTNGPHSWEVWDYALRETLAFFADVFRARYR